MQPRGWSITYIENDMFNCQPMNISRKIHELTYFINTKKYYVKWMWDMEKDPLTI